MTTTLGEKSLELIRESLRSRDMLGPFNEEKVRAVLEEIKALHDEVFTIHMTHDFRYLISCFIYFSQKFFCTMGHRNFCTEALLQKFLYPIVQKISVKSR